MPLPSRDQLGSIRWHLQRLHGSGISPPSATSEPPATPNKVPPTPNNTPATTPAVSPTKSLGTAIKNTKKMAKTKQKSTRGRSRSPSDSPEKKEKRHLCRWDADLDQKLLLSFQYASNVAGLTVPWDEIGRVVGPGITGSAVIQHLAKTRVRMQGRGLDVPPPLRRGGGNSRVPAAGTATTSTRAATADKSKPKAKPNAKPAPRKAKKATKKGNALTDDSDSDSDQDWEDDGSDAEYGQPAVKRAKTTKGPMKRKVKTEDSDDEEIPSSKAVKRKVTGSKPSEERSAFGHTDINGVPIDEDDSGNELVGTGQPWLEYEEYDEDHSTTSKTPVKKTLVVSLPTTPVKASNHENNVIGDVQSGLENYQVEDHQNLSDPFTNDTTADFVNTDGHGGVYENVGGFQSQVANQVGDFQSQIPNQDGAFTGSFGIDGGFDANIPNGFDTNMAGGGSISDAYSFGGGNTVPYPIQTSWPEYQGPMGSSSFYSSVAQTPAATSAGPDFSQGYFEGSQFDNGTFDGSYGFMANNENVFNGDNIDGNFIDDGFFGSYNHGN